MNRTTILDKVTSFFIDTSHSDRKAAMQQLTWAKTITLGIGTCLIGLGLTAVWRYTHREKNDGQNKVFALFNKVFFKSSRSTSFIEESEPLIAKIDPEFVKNTTIEEQIVAHKAAKKYLQKRLATINADIVFVSPPQKTAPDFDNVKIINNLDADIFSWYSTEGVQGDIQNDGKPQNERTRKRTVLYGVASQFNACEASKRYTPAPGKAVETYISDNTQGPLAQLQFPNQQVEIINNAANLGFNGLCMVLSEKTKTSVKHGYLTPIKEEEASLVIEQLKNNGHEMEFLCIGNIPKGEGNTEKVYEMLVAAPAFGRYGYKSKASLPQKKEIAFLCALNSYKTQFKQAIELANASPEKDVIFKPTTPGLGVFENDNESVAKGFYVAAKEYEDRLKEKNVKVELQVFCGTGPAKKMADTLGLKQGS